MPTCTVSADANLTEPLWHSFTLHRMLIIVGTVCSGVACLYSLLLITYHLRHYTKPNEQRQIIRLVFTPFVFAVFSLLAVAFYDYSVYMEALQDYYEAFAVVAIFLLFVHFVTPTEFGRENFYHDLERRSRTGVAKTGGNLKWFHTIWIGVFQYILGRTITTIVEIITQAKGVYCESSSSPKFAHIWVTVIQTIDTVLTIMCIMTFYRRLKPEMASHNPLSKLVAFKAIVFLSLIQNFFFSFMISSSHFHPTKTVSHNDLAYGIPAALICLEMTIFSIVFFFVFSAKEYSTPQHPRQSFDSGRTSTQQLVGQEPHKNDVAVNLRFGRAVADALNPMDYVHGLRYAVQILFGMKKRAGPRSNAQRLSPRQAAMYLEPARNELQYENYPHPQQGGHFPGAAGVPEPRANGYGSNGMGGAAPPQYV